MSNPNGVRDHFYETCAEPGHVHGCAGRAGGDHELEPLPDDWFEDEEGFVRAPLNWQGRRQLCSCNRNADDEHFGRHAADCPFLVAMETIIREGYPA